MGSKVARLRGGQQGGYGGTELARWAARWVARKRGCEMGSKVVSEGVRLRGGQRGIEVVRVKG